MADISISKLKRLRGELTVPGDKSISHRAAIIAAISEEISVIKNYSTAIDCQTTLNCLRRLGADIRRSGRDIIVNGGGLRTLCEPDDVLDCGNSGTTMRLLCGLLAGQSFATVLTGDASLRRRPMDRVIKPLNINGANIHGRRNNRFAPLYIKGISLNDIAYHLPVASAQVKSAMLLAGLYANGKVEIVEPIASRDHTERMLEWCGVDIGRSGNVISLGQKRQPVARQLRIPGDISSAAFLIALGLLAPESCLVLKDVGINPTRTGILKVLEDMDANVTVENKRTVANEPVGDLYVRSSALKGVEIGGTLIPRVIDELPLIAVIATRATGRTVVKDAGELRVKESDRISAIVTELKKMGAAIEETADGFIVEGSTLLRGTNCDSHNDHRIAMALSVAGWIAEGETHIDNAECVDISFPEFYKLVKQII
ncbi:MAG: 3-phosphoshikimate 1-carboxyvinyltransferase [Candidatus Marinimicrobia bacterium]|nr:3-phosphoshikimate 1-carboxyvinyltransferase [Candidatus Neomarinimicrobiota bacterium]